MATSLFQLLENHKVVIPIIQRDYAQGRVTGKAPAIREKFLTAIFKAIEDNNEPLELDFVYGYTKETINSEGYTIHRFIPLDGQQRLTTLFLLHWYVAVKEGNIDKSKSVLRKFTYETRHSSRVFCSELMNYLPEDFNKPIKDSIINQPWFFATWRNDPTISSMLTMLDSIQVKHRLYNIENIWETLISDEPIIVFHLLPMEKLSSPDDLYIKMNSRGKELTEFEYFKSQFSEIIPDDVKAEFNQKIDQVWSDLFWDLYKDSDNDDVAKLVDDGFLRFFNYITDMLAYSQNIELKPLSDNLDNYKLIYTKKENIKFLYSSLNIFSKNKVHNAECFDRLFYIHGNEYSQSKTRLFFQNANINLFKKCVNNYNARYRFNPFSIGEQLLLYAYILHQMTNSEGFNSRIRTIRNLIMNSEDTVRKEYMSSLLSSVSNIVKNDVVDEKSKFNNNQIEDEAKKKSFIINNGTLLETVNKLEDHQLLQGCLATFELDDGLPQYANEFINVFNDKNDYDAISRALLCFGDYSQKHNTWRKRFGNKKHSIWRELLTPSQRRGGFGHTKNVLYLLLSSLISNPKSDIQTIISDYLKIYEDNSSQPKDWKYYFIKYKEVRHNEDGNYFWTSKVDDHEPTSDHQYESIMMRRSMLGGFHWNPYLYTLKNIHKNTHKKMLSLENYDAPLLLTKNNATLKITSCNSGYLFGVHDTSTASVNFLTAIKDSKLIDSNGLLSITQNNAGVDVEDRIDKGLEVINDIINSVST